MQKTGDNVIWYTYDENGLVTGFRYNGAEYYYFRNAQNDIIGIVNSSGAVVANYTYDSWGNHIAITDGNGNNVASNPNHIANINPFRYRGYYYDSETGLYYLQSRYYDANVGRFLNADGYTFSGVGIIGFNMFSYCSNSVIILCDTDGKRPISSMSIQEEKMHDRVKACQWQKKVVLEKYNPAPIGNYSKGKIYLVKDEKDIKVTFSGDIIAIDKRNLEGDASQVIIKNSYKITDDNDKIDILNALNDFEKKNPSNWNRTIESMLFEWNFHNYFYNISNFIPFTTSIYESSKDVNFDNKEEGYDVWDYFVNRAID